MNKILLSGGILGLLSVLIAAYVDHSLTLTLVNKARHSIAVAIRYHQFYALIITVIGLIIPQQVSQQMESWLTRSAYVFIAGIILFSFSIYFSLLTGVNELFYLTPIGGVILMVGWSCLIRTALLKKR